MGQTGFFDIADRYAGLDARNDPLVKIGLACNRGRLARLEHLAMAGTA